MFKCDYNLWVDYHSGKINRDLTEDEKKEIRASDFAMHLLVPEKTLLNTCGGIEGIKKIYSESLSGNPYPLKRVANLFAVEPIVVLFKMEAVINCYKERKFKKRVLKKEKNVIYVNFNKK